MAFRFFDVIGRLFQTKEADPTRTFSPKLDKDGALVIQHSAQSQAMATSYYDGMLFSSERELIKKYRTMALYSECKRAINEIVSDAIVYEDNDYPISINLDSLDYGEDEKLKEHIKKEFEYCCRLLNFRIDGDNIFEQWYIDGKQIYHKIINPDNPKEGIKELRYIDPRQIQKIKEVEVSYDHESGSESYNLADEYYVYDPSGVFDDDYVSQGSSQITKISKKDIMFVHSGIIDESSKKIISHLHQAIRPYNQLREMEDAVVIYRISRAPERRVFYIDVGNIQNSQIEMYMRNEMLKYKNDLVYNMEDGETSHRRKHMAMTEDFWIPRKEGSQATSIETLPGGQNLGQIEDIEYFQKKFYKALCVPLGRLDQENQYIMGRSSEISRSEVNFSRFIMKLRKQFAVQLFNDFLKTQLVLKEIVSAEDWDEIEEFIFYDFKTDSHFAELKDAEIWRERLSLFDSFQPAVEAGYFTKKFVQDKVLKISTEEQEEMDKDKDKEQPDDTKDSPTDSKDDEKDTDYSSDSEDQDEDMDYDELMGDSDKEEELLVSDTDFKHFKLG